MKTLSTKVSPQLLERVEEHAEEIGESKSVATRELLQAGLREKEAEGRVPFAWVLIFWGAVLFTAAFIDASANVGITGGVLVGLTILYSHDRTQQAIQHLREWFSRRSLPRRSNHEH